jgi:hypothetical protein
LIALCIVLPQVARAMSEKDDVEAEERDSQPDEDRDSDPPSEPEPAAKKTDAKRAQKAAPVVAKSSSVPSSRVGVFVVLALAAGAAAGWFGQVQQAKAAAAKADAAPAPIGSAGVTTGPCRDWQDKICGSSGKQSAACSQAKGATELLTPSTCAAGLLAMPATLTRLKAARASCEKLVGKLCTDLPPGSETCAMVKDKTPSFPSQRCDEMLEHYDEVIAQLKQIDQQGGMQPGGMRMGGPGGPGGPGPHGPGPVSPH